MQSTSFEHLADHARLSECLVDSVTFECLPYEVLIECLAECRLRAPTQQVLRRSSLGELLFGPQKEDLSRRKQRESVEWASYNLESHRFSS